VQQRQESLIDSGVFVTMVGPEPGVLGMSRISAGMAYIILKEGRG
jgi:hypothetical protein